MPGLCKAGPVETRAFGGGMEAVGAGLVLASCLWSRMDPRCPTAHTARAWHTRLAHKTRTRLARVDRVGNRDLSKSFSSDCEASCSMRASRAAAHRLWAAVMAWMSPVRCRLNSSIGITCPGSRHSSTHPFSQHPSAHQASYARLHLRSRGRAVATSHTPCHTQLSSDGEPRAGQALARRYAYVSTISKYTRLPGSSRRQRRRP